MAYAAPYIDASGFHIPSYADILSDMVAQVKAIYGDDIYLGNDSADYQYLSIVALKIYDTLLAAQLAYNNRSPVTAIGSALDTLIKLNGMARQLPSYSSCVVVLTGECGAIINSGIAQDVNGNKWDLPASVTIGYGTPIGSNIIINGDMELDSNWVGAPDYTPATNARSATQAHGGTYSRELIADNAYDGIQSDPITVIAGAWYILTLWVYPVDWTDIVIDFRKGDDSGWTGIDAIEGLIKNSWNQIIIYHSPAISGSLARVGIFDRNHGTGTTYFDDFSLFLLALGTISVTAICETQGPVTALAGNINGIATPTAGWTSITNAVAAIPGQPVEADSGLRSRQAISTELPSQTVLAGTIAGIASLAGVTRFKVYENPTNDAGDLPAHSIGAIVEGDTDANIAQIIYNNRGLGCYTDGTTTVPLADPIYGVTTEIRFSRPTPAPISVSLTIYPLTGYTTATTAAIKAAIVAYLNALKIGETITISALYGVALAVMPSLIVPMFSITALTAGLVGYESTTDIPVAFNEVSTCIADNVVITVTTP